MLTQKDYCDYDTCVALKELGFPIDWFEDETYHENNTEISLYEAQKWLREEKDIDVLIKLECKDVYSSLKHYSVYLSYIGGFIRRFQYLLDEFNSYEEALSEGIKIAVKILKEENNEHNL
jgi:hypothetical protein